MWGFAAHLVAFGVFVALSPACSSSREPEEPNTVTKTIGVVKLVEAIGSGVTGTLTVVQSVNSPEVTITGRISNLAPGKHGFHIHETGTTANNCLDAGLHYNPTEMSHGSPLSSPRHVGDLGNIVTPYSAGITTVSITDSIISLEGIMGRAVVVHEDADDFVTPETGGAGARLSCGVIESCDLNCQKTLWETLKKLEGDKGNAASMRMIHSPLVVTFGLMALAIRAIF